MKKILSALIAVGALSGAAHAQQPTFDPFWDPSLALPRAETVRADEARQDLPKVSVTQNSEKPFPQDVFPDITVAYP